LKALRYIEGSSANSDVYSDQCGHGDGMVGERFIKSVFDRESMSCGCSSCASGIASRMLFVSVPLPSCSGRPQCSGLSEFSGRSSCSELSEFSGYTQIRVL
jgi:hypothetical protein